MKFKTIFNMRLAGYLMTRGFVLMDIAENTDGSGKKVFYFKESNALENAIMEWRKNKVEPTYSHMKTEWKHSK